jgi:hypothetical protein
MNVESFPYNYDFRTRFPQLHEVFRTGLEDAVFYFAEKDGNFYTIFDQSFLMEFVRAAEDEKVRNELITVYEFKTDVERQIHLDGFIKKVSEN